MEEKNKSVVTEEINAEFELPMIDDSKSVTETFKQRIKFLSPREASSLITLLDRFTEIKTSDGVKSGWKIDKLNEIEKDYLLAAHQRLNDTLSMIGLSLKAEKVSDTYYLFLKDGATSLSSNSIDNLLTHLLTKTCVRGLYNYDQLFRTTTQGCQSLLFSSLTSLSSSSSSTCRCFPSSQLEKLHLTQVSRILPSGFEDILDEEVGFGTASSFGVPNILFPNPSQFHAAHFPRAALPLHDDVRRIYRDYELLNIAVPPHEIVHCIQTLFWNGERSEWRKELEASICAFGILYNIIMSYPFLFPDGFGYEAMLSIYDSAKYLHVKKGKIDPEIKGKGYLKFREAMGMEDRGADSPLPEAGEAYLSTHPVETWYVKCRFTIEAYHAMKKEWLKFLTSCFEVEEEKEKEKRKKKKKVKSRRRKKKWNI